MPSGYIYSWTGKVSSSFGTAANWYNTTAGATATAVPGLNDEALVVASGNISGPGAAFDLGLTGTGSGLSVGGTLYGTYAFVAGTVTLGSGAGLASPNLIDIGDTTSTSVASKVATVLTIGSGSFLSATSTVANTFDVLVGQGSGASGTLAVNGTGIASAGTEGFWLGNGGNGALLLTGGGQVDAGTAVGSATRQIDLALGSNGGTGTMIVDGTNSFANFTNTVEVGFGGIGDITVADGAFFDAGEGLDSLNIGDVYNGAIGAGLVTISASTAYLAGVIEVGAYGEGILDISNGATVDAYFYLPGQAPAWSALIGAAAGSSGTLSLASGSTMLASEGIAVGSSGSGVLDVSASTLSIYAAAASGVVALDAGAGAGSSGVVNVSGGTILDNGSAGILIGGDGTGTLTVSSLGGVGGKVVTGNAGVGLAVGSVAGSSGTVVISGAGSGIVVSGEIADGSSGNGVISLSAQGQLQAGLSGTTTALVVGGPGGSGVLTLTGGSQLLATGQMLVGEEGTGALSVTGAAGVIGTASGIPALIIGDSSGVSGSVLVSDASSYASFTGGIDVGSSGSGTLTVQNQALVAVGGTSAPSLPALSIGVAAGSSGTVTLASGAELRTTGSGVVVGADGAGVLSVDSATLSVAASPGAGVYALNVGVVAGASGTVNVDGGLILDTQSAGMVVADGGAGTLFIGQAGVVVTGAAAGDTGFAVGVAAGSSGNVLIDGAGSGLAVNGTAAVGSSGSGNITAADGAYLVVQADAGGTGLVLGGSGGVGTASFASGSQGYVAGQSIIGQLGIGAVAITGGSGLVDIASGVPAMVIGASSTGTGSVLISDAGSFAQLTGGLVVGSGGNGWMGVENSAVLGVAGSTSATQPGLIIGQNTGSSGVVLVMSGAQIQAQTGIAVGASGHGELDVTSGAALTISAAASSEVPALDMGAYVGSSGVMNVVGGSVVDSQAAPMIIGDIGSGTFSISGGGGVLDHTSAATAMIVGDQSGSTGRVLVTGAGSYLSLTGGLEVGGIGPGTLTVASQALASIGTLTVGSFGDVVTSGGASLSAAALVNAGGVSASGGSMSFLGAVSGGGSLSIGGGGVITLGAAETNAVVFGSGGGSLVALTASDIGGTVTGWAAGDFVNLQSVSASSESVAGGTLSLFGSGAQLVGSVAVGAGVATNNFTLTELAGGGTSIGFHS